MYVIECGVGWGGWLYVGDDWLVGYYWYYSLVGVGDVCDYFFLDVVIYLGIGDVL